MKFNTIEVELRDDGTLDTVVAVIENGKACIHRYDCEFASSFRGDSGAFTKIGWENFKAEVLEDHYTDCQEGI